MDYSYDICMNKFTPNQVNRMRCTLEFYRPNVWSIPGPAVPTNYCTPGTTTAGCTAQLTYTGTPSATAGSGFNVTMGQMEGNKQGLLFYGLSGSNSFQWGNGTSFLCVKAPTQRMGVQNSGGTNGACDGQMSVDWNSFIATKPNALGNPFGAGTTVWIQGWFRDPPSSKSTSLSDGLQFDVQP